MLMMARLALAVLFTSIFSGAHSQVPIERETFIRMVMAICDHDALASAFTSLDGKEGPVLYVQFPGGI